MFKHDLSFAEALPSADFPSVRWVTQSAGRDGLLWILQSNTQLRIQVTYRNPLISKEPFYFSDLAILLLTSLLNPPINPVQRLVTIPDTCLLEEEGKDGRN